MHLVGSFLFRIGAFQAYKFEGLILLMDKILHDLKDPKLWELWYIPYNGSCRILSINRIYGRKVSKYRSHSFG